MIDWALRSRETGKITIAEFPNLSLSVFLVATVLGWVVKSSRASSGLSGIATGALVVWALDELLRGVNPWRRVLGGGMVAWEAFRLVRP